MTVVNGGRWSGKGATARASLGVKQLHFDFVVSVMHVTPFEHFGDEAKNCLLFIKRRTHA